MNLGAIADFICGKVNQSEAEDKAACKGFVQRRFELVWNQSLWKDSLVTYELTLSPTGYTPASNWLPEKGVLLLPPIIDRVIAVRSDQRALNGQRAEIYYRVDYDAFARTGLASEYILLPPCVWETDAAADFLAQRAAAGDAVLTVKADLLDSDNTGVTRAAVPLAATTQFLGTSQRMDALIKIAGAGTVDLLARLNGALIAAGTHYSTVTNLNGNDPTQIGDSLEYSRVITGFVVGNQYDVVLGNGVSLLDDDSRGLNADGVLTATHTSYTLTGPTTVYTGLPEAVAITTSIENHAFDVATMAAADTQAARRQRIRFLEIPAQQILARVLGKRRAPSLTDDLDEPGLSNVENCLIAFGQADMLERERQYGKAAAKAQEAVQLLAQLTAIETVQQSHNQRIIPGHGYGAEYGGPGWGVCSKADW